MDIALPRYYVARMLFAYGATMERGLTKLVQFRVPESLSERIDATASRNFQSKAEFVRQTVIEKLKADGVSFEEAQPA